VPSRPFAASCSKLSTDHAWTAYPRSNARGWTTKARSRTKDETGERMTFHTQVQQLSRSDINEISLHYDSAVDTEHGSGDHWILMAILDKHGFRTNSPFKAIELAEEIITLWYQLHK
jgi:hypothetical protein